MALEIIEPDPTPTKRVKLDRRLYLDADGAVVEEGDPKAAFLLGGKGAEIPYTRAVELGIVKPPAAKKAEPAANKQRKPAANK